MGVTERAVQGKRRAGALAGAAGDHRLQAGLPTRARCAPEDGLGSLAPRLPPPTAFLSRLHQGSLDVWAPLTGGGQVQCFGPQGGPNSRGL